MIKRGKKAQVTLFIIIAIVVIVVILLMLFFGGFKTQLTQTEITQVKNYLNDCFKLKTQEGILFIAKQGGYNTLPEAHIKFLEEKTAYYWKDNQTLIPSISTVESELTAWLDINALDCLKMPGYALTAQSCKSKVEIKETTKVAFDCPLTVQKGAATTQLKNFETEMYTPITKLLDISTQIVNEYAKNNIYICISCFDEIALANNVTIKGVPITKEIAEPEHIWFLITDKNIKFDDKNITWRFVVEL